VILKNLETKHLFVYALPGLWIDSPIF